MYAYQFWCLLNTAIFGVCRTLQFLVHEWYQNFHSVYYSHIANMILLVSQEAVCTLPPGTQAGPRAAKDGGWG